MSHPIIIALDFENLVDAYQLIDQCDPELCRVKIGKGMFTRFGPGFVKEVIAKGYDVFLDLKFHDIPNTVYDACRAAVDLGVWMLNVHACGGLAMMEKAKEAVSDDALLIAVTVLTSMQRDDLLFIDPKLSLEAIVLNLALKAKQLALDGVVSSCHEALTIKQHTSSDFKIVTPGIRLIADNKNDQKRVMTPANAIKSGADYLVIGRSITQAADPKAKLEEIILDINSNTME